MLPRRYSYAFEFRHSGWYAPRICDLLTVHDVALCLPDRQAPWVVTARHVYVRGHGPGGHYSGNYPDRTLREWAAHIRKWRRHGQTVFVSFDNDQKSAAPTDARKLNNLLAIAQQPNQGRINAPSASVNR